ncbi:hypothetical protein [Roseiconus lacunae]|uniref:hypothetical protein n=1 Tax=Roseiconus lacunae TaxID=2605694 RepID=UPI001E49D565|nr:hypothetical protein [Roseiconus lacunae]MCD0459129.1 hypothetical protein [Roseiconus lacunae]
MPDNISIGGNVNGAANFVDGDQVMGDKVAGDKVGNQVHGDNHGSMDQINVSGGDYNAKVKEAVAKCIDELKPIFEPIESESQPGESTLDDYNNSIDAFDEPANVSFRPIGVDPSLHPQTLYDEAVELSERDSIDDETKQRFENRWMEMLRYGGQQATKVLSKVGPVAIAVIEATASPPWPWNIVSAGISAAINQFKNDDSEYI